MMATSAFILMGGDGPEVDADEYCTFPTYFNLWKRDLLDLKVSWLVEDICKDCYAFADCHRYLANHTMGCNDDDGNGNIDGDGNGNGNGNGEGKHSNDGRSNDGNNCNDVSDVGVHPIRNVDLNCPEALSKKADKERELMLLQAAAHIKMARAQRALYQAKVVDAVADLTSRKELIGKKIYFCC
jgi:hypothetical protein